MRTILAHLQLSDLPSLKGESKLNGVRPLQTLDPTVCASAMHIVADTLCATKRFDSGDFSKSHHSGYLRTADIRMYLAYNTWPTIPGLSRRCQTRIKRRPLHMLYLNPASCVPRAHKGRQGHPGQLSVLSPHLPHTVQGKRDETRLSWK